MAGRARLGGDGLDWAAGLQDLADGSPVAAGETVIRAAVHIESVVSFNGTGAMYVLGREGRETRDKEIPVRSLTGGIQM